MTTKKSGGAAFPIIAWKYPNGIEGQSVQQGMTLRQWYAGMALQGLLSRNSHNGGWSGDSGVQRAVKFSFEYADAMIAEDEK